ncbi:DUF418 domain-containing protein YeiB [Nissabacter sp. SGAir0207]|uniref:DUF418 domain-containing protein YeiB n=1 Tax=Nissabacter sp. SGAir0207 TaxID=2126321 RepID=UPI0010CCED73|nr:DUF418 domain-containing protein YeiB [Nissabacter sp. SGAir0207]QCR36597.1 hypothetical protein C1N62_11070 [Nissabacter sp. SGAir0207]
MRQPRIAPLDCARGIAILGILLLNINSFGLPRAAYLNPAYLGQPSTGDALTWVIMDVLAQAKFLTMFALLFGAGLQLLLPRGSGWIQARLSWLVLLGLVHAIFFWEGDILLSYGLIGLVCWRMIREAPSSRTLVTTGVLLFVLGVAVLAMFAFITSPEPGSFWLPGAADRQYEALWKMQGGPEAWRNRLDMLSSMLISIAAQYGWELMGAMMVGAGLMRSGWLRGKFSLRHYRYTALCLITLSWLIQIPTALVQWHLGWEYRWSGYLLQAPREIGAMMQSIGYLALVYGFWPTLVRWRVCDWLSQVGRMALTNYLVQTLICTTIFYRFGWVQHFGRLQLLAFVPAVWLVNLLLSVVWLRFFPQGPVEWVWRRLTALTAGRSDSVS